MTLIELLIKLRDDLKLWVTNNLRALAFKTAKETGDAVQGAKDYAKELVDNIPEYDMVKDATAGDYAAVYHLTKDGQNIGAAINIPKDLVVKSGSVVNNPNGQPAGTYIELVLQNVEQPLYINVEDLIEYVTSGSGDGDMVVVAVSDDHKVTATITDGTITLSKLDKSVQDEIGKAHTHTFSDDDVNSAITHSATTNSNPHGVTKEMLGVVETYTNEEPLINNIGGILVKNHKQGFDNVPITDLITELLYPYTAPVINSFAVNPAAGSKEMNVALVVNSATATITKKSKSLQSVNLYKGSTLIESKTDGVASGGTFTFNINETLDGSTDISYKVTAVETGADGATITSGNQTYDFVYPYFYGVVAGGTSIDSATVLGFTKSIRAKGSHSYSFTTNNQCPVIAYPKSYGALKSIVDPNNFTQDWTRYIVNVNSATIPGVDYYVYVGGAATATAAYKFNY